jgi:chaperone modulatory protein CbpM
MAGRTSPQPATKNENVMFDATEFCRMAGIQPTALDAWAEAGWIRPRQTRNGRRFSTIDLVRADLILDLRGQMGVNEDDVVLHLVDQIHGLRRALRGAASTTAIRHVSPSLRAVHPDR